MSVLSQHTPQKDGSRAMSSLRASKRAAIVAVTKGRPKKPLKDVVFPLWLYPCFAFSCLISLAIAGGIAWLVWQLFKLIMTWLIGRGGW
jgi:hypothetical protein